MGVGSELPQGRRKRWKRESRNIRLSWRENVVFRRRNMIAMNETVRVPQLHDSNDKNNSKVVTMRLRHRRLSLPLAQYTSVAQFTPLLEIRVR